MNHHLGPFRRGLITRARKFLFQVPDLLGKQPEVRCFFKSEFWLRAQFEHKIAEAICFIKKGTTWIETISHQDDLKIFLRSDLAPHEIGKAEDAVVLGST